MYLEESKMYMASRIDQAMRDVELGQEKERRKGG